MKSRGERIAAGIAALWVATAALGCHSQTSSPPSPDAGTPPSTEGAATSSPPPTDPSAVLAAAPELTADSARMLLETAPGAGVDVVARASLLEATHGFSYLTPDELRDLGAVFGQAYAHLTPNDRGRLESYLQRVRAGDPGTPEEEARARQLFNAAVSALSPADRQRLQAVYARAIAASLTAKTVAARRASEPVVLAAAEPSPSVTPTAGTARSATLAAATGSDRLSSSVAVSPPAADTPSSRGHGEAYWRRRAQELRSAVASLEAEVAELDAYATKLAYGVSTTRVRPGTSGAMATAIQEQNVAAQKGWEMERGRVMTRLEKARRELAAAKQRLADLDDEARRDGALPGWLR